MGRKFKIGDDVICTGNVGSLWLNHTQGKVIGVNSFIGTYYVKFVGFRLELHKEQMSKVDDLNDVVLIPNGEIIQLNKDKYDRYIKNNIIRWDDEYNCYTVPYTLKNSL